MAFEVKRTNSGWDVTPRDFSSSKQTTTNLGEHLYKANPEIEVNVHGSL
jgi:hypothetical protein